MEKVNTRLAMAAMLLLFGVLLAGEQVVDAEEAKVKPMSSEGSLAPAT